MRFFRPAAAALGGLLLALSLPAGTAAATNGQFLWEGPKGKIYYVENPPDDKCLSMDQEARAARNNTKAPLVVYTTKQCGGKSYRVEPGKQAPHSFSFASVKFNPA